MAGRSATQLVDARRWSREQAESLLALLRLRPVTLAMLSGSEAWVNMPAAATPLLGRPAGGIPIDLGEFTECRLTAAVTTPGHTSAALQVALATAAPLVTASYTSILASIPIGAAGILDSGWRTVGVPLRVAGFVDVLGSGGNGAADPVLSAVTIWLR